MICERRCLAGCAAQPAQHAAGQLAALTPLPFLAAPPSPLQLNEEEKAVLRGRMEAADRVLELIKRHEASSEGALSFEGELSKLRRLGVTSTASVAGSARGSGGTL